MSRHSGFYRLSHLAVASFPAALGFGIMALCIGSTLHMPPRIDAWVRALIGPLPAPPTKAPSTWHIEGASILDENGEVVRMEGLNWSGFETANGVPGGLDTQDYRVILRRIKESGFNVVRLPISNESLETVRMPTGIQFRSSGGKINSGLEGLTSLAILDKIVVYCREIGLRVILDDHRSDSGSGPQENGLWFTDNYPESRWIEDWVALAIRYSNESAVVAFDLRNEPHSVGKGGACWDCGGPNDWHLASTRAGNAVLLGNPRLLIIVEGVDSYDGDEYWWGGNLTGVHRSPVVLDLPNHVVYSAHEYGPAEHDQPWFNRFTTSAELRATWFKHWGFIQELGIAPLYIGEFGTPDGPFRSEDPGSQGQWFSELVAYLRDERGIGWSYWTANAEDRYAYFGPGYSLELASAGKREALATLQSKPLYRSDGEKPGARVGVDRISAQPPWRRSTATQDPGVIKLW